ncbi:hypothetical protein [Streptomyces sp. NPDC086023]|uniref:hypothetical protein n=1 Tax=Streptomyces sp. NPDC086023 TaxID=3365746 RepID=UPI0037D04CDB
MTAATAVLALTASACVTVHGAEAVVPSATKAEAAQALTDFLAAYNRAEKVYDETLIASSVTGPYGDAKKANLRANKALKPGGNTKFKPLQLTDVAYTIPKKAGWPRFFIADTDSNKDAGTDKADSRVVLTFVKSAPRQPWQVAYVSVLMPEEVPVFRTDKDGWAEPVDPAAKDVAIPPGELSRRYAAYLTDGRPNGFAPGSQTTGRRAVRARNAERQGLTTRWVDRAADTGSYAPLGLRTQNGGAFVFFASRHFEQQKIDKSVKGAKLPLTSGVRAIMTGTADDTLVREFVSAQTVSLPPATETNPRALFLSRTQGLVVAKGS